MRIQPKADEYEKDYDYEYDYDYEVEITNMKNIFMEQNERIS